MKNVCVITGGGSGIGLASAKYMSKDKIIVLAGRGVSKLEKAVNELKELGYEAYAKTCDIQNRAQVKELVEFSVRLGEIKTVIHSAGLSPMMANPNQIIRVNALGSVYVNQEFSKKMKKGSVIVDVASNSAYMIPSILVNKKTFALAEQNEERFIKKMTKLPSFIKDSYKSSGLAYGLSKKFVIWYAAKCAFDYGKKGIRVVSISPGLIATDMGKLESKEGEALLTTTIEKRMGNPNELGFAIASIADERNSYLAGVDILCDGGSIIGKQFIPKK